MIKTKHDLIVFKKIAFQVFYFGFLGAIVYCFLETNIKFVSNFEKNFSYIEILLSCYLLFFLNAISFAKEMVLHKKYFYFFIKNTLMIGLLILGVYLARYFLKSYSLIEMVKILPFYFFLWLFTIATSLFYSDWMYQIENKAAMYRLVKEKNRFEVELLKSQFSPHFLFNTLNSIYSKCHSTSPEAAVMIYNLSTFMRYLIYDCSSQRVLVSKEVTLIDDFIKLYKLNYSE